MKLLVTGGAGFIGSNFIIYWLNKYPDDYIVNIDKLTYAGNLENLSSVKDSSHYKFFQYDIADKANLSKVFLDIDVVVHFAAESHVDRSIIDPSVFVKTNVLGTATLLELALGNKVKRFHHISTDEVFGSLDINDPTAFTENTPYDPRSPYAASKAAADHLVRTYYYTYNLPVTISNCSNNYGPYQHPEKLIPLAITNLIEGKKVPIYGDGNYIRDWLYVEDHCRAIDLILNQGRIGQTYCIGGLTKNINNMDLVRKIIRIMGKSDKDLRLVKDRPGHDRRYSIDWTKIKKELNWVPQYDLDHYLEKTVKWYQENLKWWQKLKTGNFKSYYKRQYGESV